MPLVLACIDIGIINLGFAVVHFDDIENYRVIRGGRYDISNFDCDRCTCQLSHDNIMADWIAHFIEKEKHHLDTADRILIERQPPMGFRDAEQLLVHCYRDKAILIQPRSFQAYFSVGHYEYDIRKSMLVRKAKFIYGHCAVAEELLKSDRAHDIADALLFAMFYVNKSEWKTRLMPPQKKISIENAETFFNQFRYKRPLSAK